MDEQLRADLARRMGMKPREVVEVDDIGDGDFRVTTHDGRKTVVRADGSLILDVVAPEPVVASVREEDRRARHAAAEAADAALVAGGVVSAGSVELVGETPAKPVKATKAAAKPAPKA